MAAGFNFSFNPKVYFGPGSVGKLGSIAEGIGENILIVTGASSFKNTSCREKLLKDFDGRKIKYNEIEVTGEPTTRFIDEASLYYRNKGINCVLSIGGGSALDAGKAISAMIPQTGSASEYLEEVGNKAHNGIKVPFIAVPTTAGTGSEATRNAVLKKEGPGGFKKSLRHDNLVPDIALIDPELTLSCPVEVTAACGMDALTQLLESYVSTASTFLSDTLAVCGISMHSGGTLEAACTRSPADIGLREKLSYSSYLSGVTLANAGLGAVHGLAGIIGGHFDIPHGTICAVLLGPVTEYNISRLHESNGTEALKKYANAGFIISGAGGTDIEEGCSLLVDRLYEIKRKLNIPDIDELGLSRKDKESIAEEAGSKFNPVKLNSRDFYNILNK